MAVMAVARRAVVVVAVIVVTVGIPPTPTTVCTHALRARVQQHNDEERCRPEHFEGTC